MRPSQGWFETDDELYYVACDGTVYLHTTPDAGHGQTIKRLPDGAWQCNPRHIDPDWHEWAAEIERKTRCTSQEATIRELSEALEAVLEAAVPCRHDDAKPWPCASHLTDPKHPSGCRYMTAREAVKRARGAS